MSNSKTAQRLFAAIENQKAPHAILITGPQGSDVDRLALEAAALCCTGSRDPAGLVNCPDYFTLGPEPILIDQVRKLQQELSVRAYSGWRAVTLFQAHRMQEPAQNALLKTLEEPPQNTLMLLSGREEGLLPTIRSRCAAIRLGAEPCSAIAGMLEEEGIPGQQANLYASLAMGAPEVAREYANAAYQALRQEAIRLFKQVFSFNTGAYVPNYHKARELIDGDWFEKKQFKSDNDAKTAVAAYVLEVWLSLLRDALRSLQVPSAPLNADEAPLVQQVSRCFTTGQIHGIIDLLLQGQIRLQRANPGLTMDLLLTDLMDFVPQKR